MEISYEQFINEISTSIATGHKVTLECGGKTYAYKFTEDAAERPATGLESRGGAKPGGSIPTSSSNSLP